MGQCSAHDLALCGVHGSVLFVCKWDRCVISKPNCILFELFCSDQTAFKNYDAAVKYCLESACLESMRCVGS